MARQRPRTCAKLEIKTGRNGEDRVGKGKGREQGEAGLAEWKEVKCSGRWSDSAWDQKQHRIGPAVTSPCTHTHTHPYISTPPTHVYTQTQVPTLHTCTLKLCTYAMNICALEDTYALTHVLKHIYLSTCYTCTQTMYMWYAHTHPWCTRQVLKHRYKECTHVHSNTCTHSVWDILDLGKGRLPRAIREAKLDGAAALPRAGCGSCTKW